MMGGSRGTRSDSSWGEACAERGDTERPGLARPVPFSLLLAWMVAGHAFFPAEDIGAHPPLCGTGHAMVLAAQAVPSAAQLPCVSEPPSGWRIGGAGNL